MRPLGIEKLCVFGSIPPVEFVNLAADLKCSSIGIGFAPMGAYNPFNYPDWSLETDASLRRDMRAALRDRGVTVSLSEGYSVRHNADVRYLQSKLDITAELGCRKINVISSDRDKARTLDQFAILAELAHARDINTLIEIGAGPMSTLDAALDAVRHVGQPHFGLLIDTMHFFRFAKASVADAAKLAPDLIGYVQLCDAPIQPRYETYIEEALYERMPPGEGELPLADFLRVLPRDVEISIEVPQRSSAEKGLSPHDYVGACVAATRALFDRILT